MTDVRCRSSASPDVERNEKGRYEDARNSVNEAGPALWDKDSILPTPTQGSGETREYRLKDQTSIEFDRKEGASPRVPSINGEKSVRTHIKDLAVKPLLSEKKAIGAAQVEEARDAGLQSSRLTKKGNEEIRSRDKVWSSVMNFERYRDEKVSGGSMGIVSRRDALNESGPIELPHGATINVNARIARVDDSPKGSPDLAQRLSRTETVRQDARRLKSATLGRMGKMFKSRPSSSTVNSTESNSNAVKTNENTLPPSSDSNYTEQPTWKEKTNSLGRMLKLVDKDGTPKKLFTHPRAGSLSRILRRSSHTEGSEESNRTSPENPPSQGILTRMLNQLKGLSGTGASTEPTARRSREKSGSSLPPRVPSANVKASSSSATTSKLPQYPHSPSRKNDQMLQLDYSEDRRAPAV